MNRWQHDNREPLMSRRTNSCNDLTAKQHELPTFNIDFSVSPLHYVCIEL